MESMDEVYRKYARTVYKYLLSLTQSQDLAEEQTQETFYQAIRSSARFDGSCKVSTWLCAIAKNVLFTWRRKHPPQEDIESIPLPEASADSAETEAISAAARIDLLRGLHRLPEPYREVMYLRIFGDLSFREIGEICGKTENWARVTFYRGKGKLKEYGGKDE